MIVDTHIDSMVSTMIRLASRFDTINSFIRTSRVTMREVMQTGVRGRSMGGVWTLQLTVTS